MTTVRRIADAFTERVVPRAEAKAACTPRCWNAGTCGGGGTNRCCVFSSCAQACTC
ncbi:hypothetical protein AB0I28_31410 [Phytomonospora sp. NPDC050363]|uniref:hypothetical protein n=1 Tax=Phytomonospora sp. NPDC050363 TaxID=3155642 RepID=UPI0033D58C29